MSEEKSIIKYDEKKGIFQWIKLKMEKIKKWLETKLSTPKKKTEEKELNDELTVEQLDNVKAGIPIREVNKEELMRDLGIPEVENIDDTRESLNEIKDEEYEKLNKEPYIGELDLPKVEEKKSWELNAEEFKKANTRVPEEVDMKTLMADLEGRNSSGDNEPTL